MINSVRHAVASFLNKNNNGYIEVSDFESFSELAQLELFKDWFTELSAIVNKINRGKSASGLSSKKTLLEERIESFASVDKLIQPTISVNKFTLPNVIDQGYVYHKILKVNYINPLTGDFIAEIDRVSQVEIRLLNSSLNTSPTAMHPVYSQEGNTITVFPLSVGVKDSVECVSVRNPKTPKWTYTSFAGGEPIFNPSANDYQDFEIPDDEQDNLVDKILLYSGVSIREIQVMRFAKSEEAEGKQAYRRGYEE
tara:strand:+ start:3306 stop:4064 length:759 start_codon:yes stop_codon:yes gene_type:complete